MNIIDKWLDSTTMYRLLIYTLSTLTIISIFFSLIGLNYYKITDLLVSFSVLNLIAVFTHILFSKVFRAPANLESTIITALIIFFVVEPANTIDNILWLIIISFASIATKYILAYHNKHIFNPAAIAILIAGLFQFGGATWWIASPYMLLPTLIAGLLIVKKIRRYDLFLSFIIVSSVTVVLYQFTNNVNPVTALTQHFVSWPTIFFATFMLTEPLSTPATRNMRILYASIAGILSSFPFHFYIINSSPELALVVANIFSFITGMRSRLTLRLKEKVLLAKDTYEFIFTKNHSFDFLPGQYLEWTSPHEKHDNRGVRRYFTISSAPHEKEVRVAIRFGDNLSTFKQNLLKMDIGDHFYATSLAGDFVLHQKNNLIFIAGGIGITPFISFIRDAIKNNYTLDAVLFYANKNDDIPYRELLDEAEQKIGLKVVYLKDFLTAEVIGQHCDDMTCMTYYLSGPHAMVESYKTLLLENNISHKNIKTDYFPGFA